MSRKWTLRNMDVQREVLRVHGTLEAAGIPHVFLKGTHLVFGLYPNPALRPVRDIDVLIPGDRASDAYATLVDGGLLPSLQHWREILDAESYQHSLPHLHAPCNTINIDIHRRLLRMHGLQAGTPAPSAHASFWSSLDSVTVAGTQIPVSAPEPLLLHLAAHAALEHHFDNGPLLLSDVAHLLQKHTIDWPALWQMAESVGATRPLALTLAVCSGYSPSPARARAEPPSASAAPSSELVNLATLALLSPAEGTHEIRVLERLRRRARTGSWLRELWQVACPPRKVMASVYDTSPTSPSLLLRYPQRWWNLISRRVCSFSPLLTTRPHAFNVAKNTQLISTWLTSDGTRPSP